MRSPRRIEKELCTFSDAGFSLMEFLLATTIFLVIGASIFSIMAEMQQNSAYQTEVQGVMENTRIAINTIERLISEAGNDPKSIGLIGITIVSSTEVRLRSDKTGSAGIANPDKGDPDGDTSDADEDVTIRYNAGAASVELVPNGGATQTLADHISALQFTYYDAAGATTNTGANVKKINVSMTGATTIPNPKTHKIYSMAVSSDIQIGYRQ